MRTMLLALCVVLQRPDNDKHPNRDKNSQSCDAGDTVQTTFKVGSTGGIGQ